MLHLLRRVHRAFQSSVTRASLLAIVGLLFVTRPVPALAAENASRPNIVVILADDLGYSDLGCYGSEIATPNLDALAKNGLRFTQFYNTARCWPTRGALLTGFYAQQIRRDKIEGIPSGGRGVRPAWARLLPEMLRPLGYRSYHSGKWHIDGQPLEGGFDRSYSLQDHNRYFTAQNHTEDDKTLPPAKPGEGYYATTAIADHAIKCLKDHAQNHADKPFFEFLAFNAPHFPLHALPQDIARYAHAYDDGWDIIRQKRWDKLNLLGIGGGNLSAPEPDVGPPYHFPADLQKLGPGEVNRPLPWDKLTSQQRDFQAAKMAIHAAMIDRMDREIGRVLAQIQSMNAFENTLIFFLSDNGASAEIMVRGDGHNSTAPPGSAESYLCLGPGWSTVSNTPFRRHKTWVHEGGIATPLVVHWPKGIAAKGELRQTPGHVIDLVPTILEAAGSKPLETWAGQPVPPAPGKSLIKAFTTDGAVKRDYLWWSHEGNRAIRVGDWKLVAAGPGAPWELYNLSTDRAESKNLATEMPDKARELEALWKAKQDEFAALAKRSTAKD